VTPISCERGWAFAWFPNNGKSRRRTKPVLTADCGFGNEAGSCCAATEVGTWLGVAIRSCAASAKDGIALEVKFRLPRKYRKVPEAPLIGPLNWPLGRRTLPLCTLTVPLLLKTPRATPTGCAWVKSMSPPKHTKVPALSKVESAPTWP
jgi:hypothetical protein